MSSRSSYSSHFNDTSNLYHLSEKKRKNTERRHITCCIGLLFYSLYMFINPGLMYQKMPDIFSMDQSSLIVMKIIYAFIIYSVLIMWLIMKAIRFLGDDSQKNWKSRLYFGMKGLFNSCASQLLHAFDHICKDI